MEMGRVPLTVTTSDFLAKIFLPGVMTLCAVRLEGLLPKGRMLPSGDTTMIPLNWE